MIRRRDGEGEALGQVGERIAPIGTGRRADRCTGLHQRAGQRLVAIAIDHDAAERVGADSGIERHRRGRWSGDLGALGEGDAERLITVGHDLQRIVVTPAGELIAAAGIGRRLGIPQLDARCGDGFAGIGVEDRTGEGDLRPTTRSQHYDEGKGEGHERRAGTNVSRHGSPRSYHEPMLTRACRTNRFTVAHGSMCSASEAPCLSSLP